MIVRVVTRGNRVRIRQEDVKIEAEVGVCGKLLEAEKGKEIVSPRVSRKNTVQTSDCLTVR